MVDGGLSVFSTVSRYFTWLVSNYPALGFHPELVFSFFFVVLQNFGILLRCSFCYFNVFALEHFFICVLGGRLSD